MNDKPRQVHDTPLRSADSSQPVSALDAAPWAARVATGDEIDLVDLGVLLWRYRRVMLAILVVFLVLTMVATIFKRLTYSYTTSLQLGSTLVQTTGSVVPLMSAPAVAGAIQSTYVPQAFNEYLNGHQARTLDIGRLPKISASGSAGGDSVVLSCEAKEAAALPCIAVERIAVENFIANNAQFAAVAENKLASLEAQAKVLQVQLERLDASTKLYRQQADDLSTQITRMQQAGLRAARAADSGSAALSNLILDTEVQRASDTLAKVRQQLDVVIPGQKAQLTQQLSDNAHDQTLEKQNISLGFTRMVNPGLRSIKPVGLTRWAVLGLGIIISIVLAVFSAFVAAFLERIRDRLRTEAGT